MPYAIELMSLGGDFYSLLQASADRLNGVQKEFEFRLSSPNQRAEGMGFKRDNYRTRDIWSFLKAHKTATGGNRPFIIAFVNAPLESDRLSNLFGSHDATNGFAAVTLHNLSQYVKEEKRYCCYYMVRYALSFVNPSIKSHDDPNRPERAKCYFHKKMHKPDIRASMDSGHICDECRQQLDNPPDDGVCNRLSAEERQALAQMMYLVSGDLPHAIVMKGGGVKGLAFGGALLELEKYFWFDRHVGTSAGAIAAALLAANYSPTELVGILRNKNFREFMDAGFWKIPLNLVAEKGMFPGEHFRLWIAGLIGSKTRNVGETKLSELNGALLYAARRGSGTVVFDSNGERRDAVAAFAVRCSMSIPVFFFPQMVDGRRTFDGGMRNNFPLKKFLDDHRGKPYVAVYLGRRDDRNRRWFGSELLDIWIDGEEREIVDRNRENIVVIDTSPIGTVDFKMTEMEKDFLLKVGRASALRFLFAKKFNDGPGEDEVTSAEQEAEFARTAVRCGRSKRRRRRFILAAFVLVVVAVVLWF